MAEEVSPQSLHPRHLPIISLPHSSISFIPPYNPPVPNSLLAHLPPPSISSCLCFWAQEGQKSRLLVTGTVLPWSQGKKKKKENWGTVQGGPNNGSSVLLLSGVRREKDTERGEDRWMGTFCAVVSGVLYC